MNGNKTVEKLWIGFIFGFGWQNPLQIWKKRNSGSSFAIKTILHIRNSNVLEVPVNHNWRKGYSKFAVDLLALWRMKMHKAFAKGKIQLLLQGNRLLSWNAIFLDWDSQSFPKLVFSKEYTRCYVWMRKLSTLKITSSE